MEKVQGWLQENLGVILGVCVGVTVIEVWSPPFQHPPHRLPPPKTAPALQTSGVEGGVG